MGAADVFNITTTVIMSLGGGGLIVFGLSSFLGKLWAERLMQKDKEEHDRSLLNLRKDLERDANENLELLKKQLEIGTTTHLRETADKLAIYRAVVDSVSEILGDFDQHSRGEPHPQSPEQRLDQFNRQRLKMYGYMAMLAPQNVVDAYDQLADYLLGVAKGDETYCWDRARKHALALLNEVRADVGLNKTPIAYRGIKGD